MQTMTDVIVRHAHWQLRPDRNDRRGRLRTGLESPTSQRGQRIFAIKIPPDPAFRKQLQREGKLPDIHHENIVPIVDSDTRGADVPYIVMPYYEGGTLADLIAQHPTGLSEERVEALLKDIPASRNSINAASSMAISNHRTCS